jgi:hypothetical protein
MSRKLLLAVILVLATVFAVYAQTDFTIKTYVATSTTSSDTTVTTQRAKYQGFGERTMVVNDVSSSTATGVVTITQQPTEVEIARRISETEVASDDVQIGVLYTYWDTATELLTMKYKNATGTDFTILPSSSTLAVTTHNESAEAHLCTIVASAAAVALKADLAGGNAFTGNQTLTSGELRVGATGDLGAFPLQTTGKSFFTDEVSIGSTTDMGAFVLQLAGDAILKDDVSAIFRVQTASTTGYAMFQLLGDASSEAYIAKNGSAYVTTPGADALEIYNAAACPIVFTIGVAEAFRLCADEGAVQFQQIATPTLATGVMYLDSTDGQLKISLDGAAWTVLSD